MNCGQRRVCIVSGAVGERSESKFAAVNRSGDGFQRLDLRSRQSKPGQPSRTDAQNSGRVEWIESGR